ncbi:MAG: hypothetical protein HY314_16970 [Acidobacteria bacterium]|nr:hypothetical protein [Acidobacteriota bacterium]
MKLTGFCISLLLLGVMANTRAISQSCPNAVDYIDPTYGSRIRQLEKPDGHEHNLYHYRDPWNANNTYMVGVQSDRQQQNWRVVLYDGDGCFIKQLWTLDQYDWRLVWDRHDPDILYTWKFSDLYRYNVVSGMAELLKSFAPLRISPAGPSVNQAGDRILVITNDGAFHSYYLPDMQDERTFRPSFPAGCSPSADNKERYIGYKNYIVTACFSNDGATRAMFIYDDTGVLFHQFDGLAHGHADFSPDGKFAYPRMWDGGRGGASSSPLEVHVVNIDGTNDQALYSIPQSQAKYVQNFHITWPKRVNDWLIVSLFPSAGNLPPTYAPPLDEILLVHTDGTYEFLARTGTSITTRGEMFWAEPLASPSSDGKRVSFNSNRSGTIDQCILFVDREGAMGWSTPDLLRKL